jgi:hypothetical protein
MRERKENADGEKSRLCHRVASWRSAASLIAKLSLKSTVAHSELQIRMMGYGEY